METEDKMSVLYMMIYLIYKLVMYKEIVAVMPYMFFCVTYLLFN